MNFLNLNNIQKILQFFVLIFPLVIILKSAAINIVLFVISLISILLIIKNKDYSYFKDYFVAVIIFFLGFVFINSIIHFQNIEIVIKSLGNYRFLFLSFAVFLVLENISKKNYSLFIFFNFIIIIIIGLDVLYQYNFNKNIFGFVPSMCEPILINCTRFSGMFGSELIAGAYLSQIGLLLFFLAIGENLKKSLYKKIIIYAVILFLFLIIILTGERNALLIFLICISVLCFFYKKIVIFLTSMTIFTIIFLLIAQNSFSVKTRYLDFFTHSISVKESSITKKIINTPWAYHYEAAFELFLEKPITGHGYKSFRVKCSETKIDKKLVEQKRKYRGYRGCSSHPHNYMLEMLSENGMIGFLFFVTILIIILNKILKIRKYPKSLNQFLVISIGSLLLALMFPFKPSGSFLSTFNASIFFYLLGFFIYYTKQLNQE